MCGVCSVLKETFCVYIHDSATQKLILCSCDTVSLLHIISPASDTTSTHDIVLEDVELQ